MATFISKNESGGGGGKVLQVVQATKTDTASTTSTSFVSTGLSASITPSNTANKILVLVQAGIGSSSTATHPQLELDRDGTPIHIGDAAGSRTRCTTATFTASIESFGAVEINYLDSPGTTSSTTYTVNYREQSSGTVYLNRSATDTDSAEWARGASSIILIEIDES